jgi:hypothetical protein
VATTGGVPDGRVVVVTTMIEVVEVDDGKGTEVVVTAVVEPVGATVEVVTPADEQAAAAAANTARSQATRLTAQAYASNPGCRRSGTARGPSGPDLIPPSAPAA